ncbi:hypothetical protein [Glycomyces tenuis]|uniref:hypothetical protein n=1 Tax=Glycomyces tenuis TaxID=58116 RepID=UPI0004038C98|nr:hypothetical protein [Glycomyces tenuis]
MTAHPSISAPLRRLAAAGLLGLAMLTGCESNEESPAPGITEAEPGECLPREIPARDAVEFTVDCDDEAAFWTLTAISGDSGASSPDGADLVDDQPLFDLCGEEITAYFPGRPHTGWDMVHDEESGEVEYLFCFEAIGRPDAEGATPVVPAVEECFESSDVEWWTRPCDPAVADAVVTDVFELELEDRGAFGDVFEELSGQCTGSAYRGLVDDFGRTSGIICFDYL